MRTSLQPVQRRGGDPLDQRCPKRRPIGGEALDRIAHQQARLLIETEEPVLDLFQENHIPRHAPL
jgi:hypothetical protein